MPITFVPRRGAILMCNYGPLGGIAPTPTAKGPLSVPPEMSKVRRCVVVSPEWLNRKHGPNPGLCVVVPLSATVPAMPDATMVPFPLTLRYRTLTKDVWAKCALVAHVSHDRLDRPRIGPSFMSEFVSGADMARIEAALKVAQGIIP